MKRIGVIGTRRRDSLADLSRMRKAFFQHYEEGDEIVSGGCPSGGDSFAERIAKRDQIPIKIHYAQWKRAGRAAGFIRNTDIARDSDVLIAMVAEDRTGGTEDTIKKFRKLHGPDATLILV